MNNMYSKVLKLKGGVRQGCFNSSVSYTTHIMHKVSEDWQDGATIGGSKISNLRYTGNT